MATTPAPLHVHCGDHAGEVARRAALPGEVLVWKDSSAVGPSSPDPLAHRQLRAQWWGVPPESVQVAQSVRHAGEVVLWCGPDPWEQIALVELVAGLPDQPTSVVPLGQGVGRMAPEELAPAFARRRDAGGLVPLMLGVWSDLGKDDRHALARWVESLASELRLPHMSLALARVLEDRRDGRTERQVRALLAEGVREVPDLMARLRVLEHPRHGAWYGDAVVRRLVDQIARG